MRTALLLLVVVVAVAACGHKEVVHRPGEPYVSDIQIDGNVAISDEDLRGGLAQTRTINKPLDVDPYQTELDAQRIRGAYLRLGFFTVDVAAKVEPHGDARTIRYIIKEGPRATLAAVEFPSGPGVGLPPELPFAKARALVKLADGAPFAYDAYDDAKEALQRALLDAGYAHARIAAEVAADRVHAQATLQYTVQPGPRCTFGEVSVEGVPSGGGLEHAIRVRVPFHSGDTYSFSAVEATQRALYGFGRFSTVQVQPALGDDSNAKIGIKVVVSEANRHELRAGGGVGLDPLYYSGRLRFQYTQAGVFDPLTTLGVEFRPELAWLRDTSGESNDVTPLIKLIGRLTRQDLFYKDVKGELEGGLDYLTIEDYTQIGGRVRVGVSAPLGTPKLQVRVGWQFALYTFSNISPAIQPVPTVDSPTERQLGLDSTERLGAYTQAISLDLRDNQLEPTSGVFAAVQLAEGSKYALGAFDYTQLSGVVRGYLPLRFGVVLAGRFHLATIMGQVPVTERFFGGGASSDRGFSERRMSPTVSAVPQAGTSLATVAIGGAGLIETGAELRVPFALFGLRLGGVAFIDGGDDTNTASEVLDELTNPFSKLNWAAGGGLRLFTPIGPIRFDIGYRLNRFGPTEPEPGQRLQLFLGAGEAF